MSPQGGKRFSRWTFAAGCINALAAFLFEVCMFGDIGSAIIGLAIAGIVIGAALATSAIFGLPWLWALAKPTLRALVG